MPKLPPPPPRLAQKRSSFCVRRGGEEPAVGRDDVQRGEVVAGEAVLAADHADAAAQGEPGDAHRRAGTGGQEHPVGRELRVDVDQLGAGADDRRHGRRVGGDGVQAGDVDDQSRSRGVAAVAVAAAAGGGGDAVGPGESEATLDVGRRGAVGHGGRVEGGETEVVDELGRGVGGRGGQDEGAVEGSGEGGPGGGIEWFGGGRGRGRGGDAGRARYRDRRRRPGNRRGRPIRWPPAPGPRRRGTGGGQMSPAGESDQHAPGGEAGHNGGAMSPPPMYGPDVTFVGIPRAAAGRPGQLRRGRGGDHRGALRRRDLVPGRLPVRAPGHQDHRLPAPRRPASPSGSRGRPAARARGGRHRRRGDAVGRHRRIAGPAGRQWSRRWPGRGRCR